jgi:hypothetical protein
MLGQKFLEWTRVNGVVQTKCGRFRIEGHWDKKPGYYVLVEPAAHYQEKGTKLKELKARAERLASHAEEYFED